MPQDIALMESTEKQKEALAEWTRTIRRWERWLGTGREAEALDQLLNLSDPIAAPVIVENLAEEQNPANRLLWIRVLGRLATPDAILALMQNSLADPRRGNRTACLDQLEQLRPPQATAFYVHALSSTDNLRIRRAAVALKRLGDDSAIEPLINALVSQHQVVITEADPNRMDAIFSGGSSSSGTGFSTGQRTKVEKRLFANREALDALIHLSGANFQFDQDAWRQWYTARDLPEAPVNLRRDP
jgi:HEAT repeat protein